MKGQRQNLDNKSKGNRKSGQKRLKKFITMKSLILAQDER